MGVLGNLENTVGQGLKKTGGLLNVTRKKRLDEKKSTTQSEKIFLILGILLGLTYGLLVKEEGQDVYTNVIFGVTIGTVGGIVFGYVVDMVSVLIEAFFGTLIKIAPPLLITTIIVAVIFLIIWAYTKEFGPIGSITFEQMNTWMVKITDAIKIVFDYTIVKLFNAISALWDFLLNN